MRRVNLAEAEFAYDAADLPGFRSGMLRLGPLLGAERTGVSLYELPPGEVLCPYHYEGGEEERLVVLAGRPSLRHPDSDKVGVWTGVAADDAIVRRPSRVDYSDGEAR